MVQLLFKDIWYDRLRVLLTIIALSVAVFTFFILNAFAQAMSDYYQADAASRNLIVVQADSIDPSDSSLEAAVLQAAQDLPDDRVSRVSPVIMRHMRVDERVVILRAAPLEYWENIFHLWLQQGTWPQPSGEVVAGEGTALANGWQVGSKVSIYNRDFLVSGIVSAPGSSYASIWMPVEAAHSLFGDERGYQGLYIQAAAGADIENLRQQLIQNPAFSERYAVFFEDSYASRYNQILKDLNSLMVIASNLALLAVCLGTYTATNLDLTERSREVGMLRAVGFLHRHVLQALAARALLQTWLAFSAGLAAALAYIGYRQAHDPLFVLGVNFNFHITWQMVGQGLFLTSLCALAGVWLSARYLLRSQTTDLLRQTGA